MALCGKCSQPNPSGASFCMRCGAPLAPEPAQPTGGPAMAQAPNFAPPIPKAPNRSKSWLWAILGLAGAAAAVWLGASGLLQNRSQASEGKMLQRPGEPETPGLLAQKGEPKAGLTERIDEPPPESKKMPPEIRDWLEHLHRTEQKRNRLANRHIAEFTTMMFELQGAGIQEALKQMMEDGTGESGDMKPPAADVAKNFERAREGWRELVTSFDAVQPPAECVPIRNQYDVALRETSAAVYDLIDVLEQASQPNADAKSLVTMLQSMKGNSKAIDEAGIETDHQVQDICDKYETRKWFDIAGDIGSGGLFGNFSGGL